MRGRLTVDPYWSTVTNGVTIAEEDMQVYSIFLSKLIKCKSYFTVSLVSHYEFQVLILFQGARNLFLASTWGLHWKQVGQLRAKNTNQNIMAHWTRRHSRNFNQRTWYHNWGKRDNITKCLFCDKIWIILLFKNRILNKNQCILGIWNDDWIWKK